MDGSPSCSVGDCVLNFTPVVRWAKTSANTNMSPKRKGLLRTRRKKYIAYEDAPVLGTPSIFITKELMVFLENGYLSIKLQESLNITLNEEFLPRARMRVKDFCYSIINDNGLTALIETENNKNLQPFWQYNNPEVLPRSNIKDNASFKLNISLKHLEYYFNMKTSQDIASLGILNNVGISNLAVTKTRSQIGPSVITFNTSWNVVNISKAQFMLIVMTCSNLNTLCRNILNVIFTVPFGLTTTARPLIVPMFTFHYWHFFDIAHGYLLKQMLSKSDDLVLNTISSKYFVIITKPNQCIRLKIFNTNQLVKLLKQKYLRDFSCESLKWNKHHEDILIKSAMKIPSPCVYHKAHTQEPDKNFDQMTKSDTLANNSRSITDVTKACETESFCSESFLTCLSVSSGGFISETESTCTFNSTLSTGDSSAETVVCTSYMDSDSDSTFGDESIFVNNDSLSGDWIDELFENKKVVFRPLVKLRTVTNVFLGTIMTHHFCSGFLKTLAKTLVTTIFT